MNPNTIDSIIKQLIASHTTISTMESCTSGLIASLITDTEGASAIFPGGYVTYLNETKVLVGVDPSVIEIHGVYSPECAFQTNVSGMTRHEIKQLYVEQVFAELEMILTSSL